MTVDDIALTLEYGLGPRKISSLLEVFGTAVAVYAASPVEIVRRAGINEATALRISRKEYHRQAEKELKYLQKHNLTAIASTDAGYPSLMREMNGYHPHVIYVMGNPEVLLGRTVPMDGVGDGTAPVCSYDTGMVSMVGTRKISNYGQVMCDRLVKQMAERVPGLCIVSGLAFGVDVQCHRAALRYGVPTVAVIPSVLPDIVPSQHSHIARDILDHGGAIVSELHSNSKQTGDFYISRNRIIAGLSEGTVIVEADYESGSLTTARYALDYNRQLMAVPGRATDEVAFGTNNLIKNNEAQMICSGEDIIRTLMWDLNAPEVGEKPAKAVAPVSADAKGLLGCFESGNAVSVDRLCEVTGMDNTALAPILLELEFAGMVRRLPGGMYEKLG